jgi:2-keto-3-deoxy-L-rhamnonate aldolase RhmA
MAVRADLKRMSGSRRLKLGHFVCEFATPGIGYILKAAGCEFVMFDMEHSGFSFETVKATLRFMEAAELPTIVRVPGGAYDYVARACDMGAEGLTVPNVRTAEETRRIVGAMKYRPLGNRGVSVQIAHDRYVPGPVTEKLAAANERTTFFPLIESEEGARNAAAIAAVDGVDGLFLGHYDLSVSLGVPGAFNDPKFTDAVRRIVDGAKAGGRALGRNVGTPAEVADAYAAGFDFITFSGDVWLYQQALSQGLAAARAGVRAE